MKTENYIKENILQKNIYFFELWKDVISYVIYVMGQGLTYI